MEPRTLLTDDRGSGEPVVLLPGGLTGWLSWIPHQERLADRFRVVRVQPIHNELGSAGVPGDPTYSIETEREALRLTLDTLDLDAVHLAGWSGGGRAALEFAMAHPDRVRSLALVEPAAYWILDQLREGSGHDREIGFLRDLVGRDVDEHDLARFLVLAGFVADEHAARAHPNWDRWFAHRMALSWQGEALDTPRRSVDELAGMTVPTVLFKGTLTADWLKRMVDVLGERLPAATVVELEGDHACHIQSIDAFLAALERHLGDA